MIENDSESLNHILVNMAGPKTEFAMVNSKNNQDIHSMRSYNSADFVTASDCFMAYAKEQNISLRDHKCAIAVSCAVNGDVIKVMHGGWTFSINGFGYMFKEVPLVINEVVAMTWANISGNSSTHRPIGMSSDANFRQAGKYLTIKIEDGAGAATLLNRGDGRFLVNDSEHGHVGFSPSTAIEFRLLETLSKTKAHVSWEDVLCLPNSDPLWSKPGIELGLKDVIELKASLLGAFAGDAALSQAAWSGVTMTGLCTHYLTDPKHIDLFAKRFEAKNAYNMNLKYAPRWLISMEHAELRGCAMMLAHLRS